MSEKELSVYEEEQILRKEIKKDGLVYLSLKSLTLVFIASSQSLTSSKQIEKALKISQSNNPFVKASLYFFELILRNK